MSLENSTYDIDAAREIKNDVQKLGERTWESAVIAQLWWLWSAAWSSDAEKWAAIEAVLNEAMPLWRQLSNNISSISNDIQNGAQATPAFKEEIAKVARDVEKGKQELANAMQKYLNNRSAISEEFLNWMDKVLQSIDSISK